VQICFCQNFVNFPPILIIFGRMMAKRLKLCERHSFSTSPNLHHSFFCDTVYIDCVWIGFMTGRRICLRTCSGLSRDFSSFSGMFWPHCSLRETRLQPSWSGMYSVLLAVINTLKFNSLFRVLWGYSMSDMLAGLESFSDSSLEVNTSQDLVYTVLSLVAVLNFEVLVLVLDIKVLVFM